MALPFGLIGMQTSGAVHSLSLEQTWKAPASVPLKVAHDVWHCDP
jgi:hypothetical protein